MNHEETNATANDAGVGRETVVSSTTTPSPRPDATIDMIVRSRRTNLAVDSGRAVDDAVVADLCELATWAPNHKRTEPWLFTVVTGARRVELGEVIASTVPDAGPDKLAKIRAKYLRAPTIVLVGSTHHPVEALRHENRDAVAAGVQNMLLGATARGLASFWASVPAPTDRRLTDWCGWDTAARVVALVYLGHPLSHPTAPQRRPPLITWHRDPPNGDAAG